MRLSTCKTENVIASQFACQALWLSSLCNVLKLKCKSPKEMKIDKTSAINLAKNSVSYEKSKHKDLLRDQVAKGKLELK